MANRFVQAGIYTTKYKRHLVPCKYCGNDDVRVVSDRTIFSPRNVWSVCCATPKCDCSAFYDKAKDAVEEWERKHKVDDKGGVESVGA